MIIIRPRSPLLAAAVVDTGAAGIFDPESSMKMLNFVGIMKDSNDPVPTNMAHPKDINQLPQNGCKIHFLFTIMLQHHVFFMSLFDRCLDSIESYKSNKQ